MAGEYALKFWRHGYLVFTVAEMFSGLKNISLAVETKISQKLNVLMDLS